jgi:hypothetical protein
LEADLTEVQLERYRRDYFGQPLQKILAALGLGNVETEGSMPLTPTEVLTRTESVGANGMKLLANAGGVKPSTH